VVSRREIDATGSSTAEFCPLSLSMQIHFTAHEIKRPGDAAGAFVWAEL